MPKRNRMRNPVAASPLLRKGGVHIQSRTGQRVRYRLQTQSAIDEWQEEFEELSITRNKGKGSHDSLNAKDNLAYFHSLNAR